MIDLYYASTPNGWKISIMLEECGLEYRTNMVNLSERAQFEPGFISVNPNSKIPAIVDHNPKGGGGPITVFESGAILLYLAEKTGRYIPDTEAGRYAVIQWLMWQMAGLGPMLGQHGHFKLYAAEHNEYAINRYRSETERLYAVMNRRLSDNSYLGGADYSIADMACFPWVRTYKAQEIDLALNYPNVRQWYDRLKSRPRLQRGVSLGRDVQRGSVSSDRKNAGKMPLSSKENGVK